MTSSPGRSAASGSAGAAAPAIEGGAGALPTPGRVPAHRPGPLSSALTVVEIALTIGVGYACHLYYNLIGHLASLRGVDHGPSLVTPLDRALPFLTFLSPFYAVAYITPAIVVAVVIPRAGKKPEVYRRLIASFLVLLGVHYTIYLLWPTSANAIRLPDEGVGTGFFAAVVRSQYRIATIWCAFPSLHTSACWFFYRLLSRHRPVVSRFYLLWYAGMFFGTFGIKIHFVADAVSGMLLGECADRFVLSRLDRADALRLPRVPLWARLIALFGMLAILGTGLPLLMHATGFTGPLYTISP